MGDVSVPWGQEELALALPPHWTMQQVAKPDMRPASADWLDRLALAISQPISGLPLEKLLAARHGGKIVLVVEDGTRHSPLPQILPVILREIDHAQIDRDRVEIFIASGMHPPMTPREAAKKLGPSCEGIRWRCNPWKDRRAYVSLGRAGKVDVSIDRGVAEALLRILISSVSPHMQAGFGGGYKMLVPGCAHLETIQQLHRQGLGREFAQQVGSDGEKNAMRSAIDAAGALVDAAGGRSFAVSYLLDEQDLPSTIVAGDVLPTQQMLAKLCAVASGVVTARSADVVIADAHPRDLDLWQSFKCIANTQWAVRPGGVIICLTRCPLGMNRVKPPPWPLGPRNTRRLVGLLGPESLSATVTRLVPRLAGDAAFFVRLAARALHRNPILMVAPVLYNSGAKFPGIEIFPAPEPAFAAADARLGKGPQRVVVFPAGGVTYPVIPGR
jgi:hypothetical protein